MGKVLQSEPTDGVIAQLTASILVFPTGHVVVKHNRCAEIHMHIGMDTVVLE